MMKGAICIIQEYVQHICMHVKVSGYVSSGEGGELINKTHTYGSTELPLKFN